MGQIDYISAEGEGQKEKKKKARAILEMGGRKGKLEKTFQLALLISISQLQVQKLLASSICVLSPYLQTSLLRA